MEALIIYNKRKDVFWIHKEMKAAKVEHMLPMDLLRAVKKTGITAHWGDLIVGVSEIPIANRGRNSKGTSFK